MRHADPRPPLPRVNSGRFADTRKRRNSLANSGLRRSEWDENGEQPSPSPAGTPNKPLTGDVKGADEEKPKGETAAQAEGEPEKEGEMSPKQAAALLESMKDEEQKVQLDEHKPRASCL